MLNKLLPWSLRGVGPFLTTYGDGPFFGGIKRTAPIEVNPSADTSIHSIVPHRHICAYLLAVKSFLRYYNDVAVYIHDDGSLADSDVALIKAHIRGALFSHPDETAALFLERFQDPFLSRVRESYTSYLKLFDPTFLTKSKRIVLLDTDTLFIRRPEAIIHWAQHGGTDWYHRAPTGSMKISKKKSEASRPENMHIQTLIVDKLDEINRELGRHYSIGTGFCAGFVGYDAGTVDFSELKRLLEVLYKYCGDRIFEWGAEQTVHGLLLCGNGAEVLPIEDYLVYTHRSADIAEDASFIHFVGETRFYRFLYPRLASRVIRDLMK